MTPEDRKSHWERVYATKAETEVSWCQADPAASLEAPPRAAARRSSTSAAGRLASSIGWSITATRTWPLSTSRRWRSQRPRRGSARRGGRLIGSSRTLRDGRQNAPTTSGTTARAFHFLVDPADRAAMSSPCAKPCGPGVTDSCDLRPDGRSGLPVMRRDRLSLAAALGPAFALIETWRHDHVTPAGAMQHFQFSLFRRVSPRTAFDPRLSRDRCSTASRT